MMFAKLGLITCVTLAELRITQAAQARGQDAVLEVFAAWEASQSVPDASSPEEQRKKRRWSPKP